MIFLLGVCISMLSILFISKDMLPSGVFVLIMGLAVMHFGGNKLQLESEINRKEHNSEIIRLCDATNTGWYWRNNSQVVCPKDWVKTNKLTIVKGE